MSDCCTPRGYRWIFSERRARGEARRYRRKGLDPPSRRIYELLRERGVAGQTVLEVGGGVGGIQIELLKAGAARAVSVELTPTWEEEAVGLLREAGLEDRVQRRVMDFVEADGQVEPADIVVMNRVICCYPDMPRLAAAAAEHTRGVLVMSFPKETWWVKCLMAVGNFGLTLTRRGFHIFVHPPERILATAESHGLKRISDQRGLLWEVVALERPA